jgi:hypothetical protein
MITVKNVRGESVRLTRHQFESLRMLMDWQLKQRGLDVNSVNAMFCLQDEIDHIDANMY